MASGTITGTTSNPAIVSKIEWSESGIDVAANTSIVTATLYLTRSDGYRSWGQITTGVEVANQGYSYDTRAIDLVGDGVWIPVCASTRTVQHNPDGTKQIWISATGSSNFGLTSITCAQIVTLDTIPRASQVSLSVAGASNWFTLGEGITVYTNRADPAFTHAIEITFGAETARIPATGTFTEGTKLWTSPAAWSAQIPNATYGYGVLRLHTYSAGVLLGTSQVNFAAGVPASAVPTISTLTTADPSGALATIGAYVAGVSQLTATMSGDAGVYGSTPTAWSTELGASTIPGKTGTHPVTGSGVQTVTAKVVDSRGRTGTKTATVTVLPYTSPVISTMAVERCLSTGVVSATGTYLKAVHSGSAASLKPSTAEKNTLGWTLWYRKRGNTVWIAGPSLAPSATLAWGPTASIFGGGAITITNSWEVQLRATDKLQTAYTQSTIGTGAVPMSWGKDGIGVGKLYQSGALDVLGATKLDGDLEVTGTITKAGQNIDARYLPREAPLSVVLTTGTNAAENTQVGNLALTLPAGTWDVSIDLDAQITAGVTTQFGLALTGTGATKVGGSRILNCGAAGRWPVPGRWVVTVPNGGTVAVKCELLWSGTCGVGVNHSWMTAHRQA